MKNLGGGGGGDDGGVGGKRQDQQSRQAKPKGASFLGQASTTPTGPQFNRGNLDATRQARPKLPAN